MKWVFDWPLKKKTLRNRTDTYVLEKWVKTINEKVLFPNKIRFMIEDEDELTADTKIYEHSLLARWYHVHWDRKWHLISVRHELPIELVLNDAIHQKHVRVLKQMRKDWLILYIKEVLTSNNYGCIV